MKVTPKEATKTRCPMKCSRMDLTIQEANCLAHNCMAWRWANDEYQCPKCDAVYSTNSSAFECHSRAAVIVRTGYCGLAGKPMDIM